MNCTISQEDLIDPYVLLFKSLSLIPLSHYFVAFVLIILLCLHYFLEIHFFRDVLFTGLRGDPVSLTCNLSSELYQSVGAKCRLLHGRYSPTPWLSSPHLQTAFLSFFGNAPQFCYKRHLFHATDGGTVALDWLMHSDVVQGITHVHANNTGNDHTPVVIVIPGLTSDSSAAYIKHLAFNLARKGWNVVVSNHRGLGGVSLTSDSFYNAGWTDDIRKVIDHIHRQYPEAPIFAVGTSIGANVLVKYLGEEGPDSPLAGASAVCSPWDLLICDRFINRLPVQKLYDKVLTIGLQGYAQLHQSIMSRITDWDGIKKSRSVRDFDNYATRLDGKFETVDNYYRRSSSVQFMGNVSVPLLCISSLDDPVCTREAIPWDECRINENIILATTRHGGHLAYFEGMAATSVWWVRAVEEYFAVLQSSPADKRKKIPAPNPCNPLESSIDQGPYVNIAGDGMLTAVSETQIADDSSDNIISSEFNNAVIGKNEQTGSVVEQQMVTSDQSLGELVLPLRKRVDELSRQSKKSLWLLAYIAIVTTWPILRPVVLLSLRKRFNRLVPTFLLKK